MSNLIKVTTVRHGHFLFEPWSGRVVEIELSQDGHPWPERVDVYELKMATRKRQSSEPQVNGLDQEYSILDVGYWHNGGAEYSPPCLEWREREFHGREIGIREATAERFKDYQVVCDPVADTLSVIKDGRTVVFFQDLEAQDLIKRIRDIWARLAYINWRHVALSELAPYIEAEEH